MFGSKVVHIVLFILCNGNSTFSRNINNYNNKRNISTAIRKIDGSFLKFITVAVNLISSSLLLAAKDNHTSSSNNFDKIKTVSVNIYIRNYSLESSASHKSD